MSRLALSVSLALLASAPLFAQEVKRADLKPGLIFSAGASGDKPTLQTRLEPLVGLTLAADESVHPQLKPNDGGYNWTGYIQIITAGKYKFDSALLGKLHVSIDGIAVLSEAVAGDTAKSVAG